MKRELIFNLIMLVVSILVVLTILEGGARLLTPKPPIHNYQGLYVPSENKILQYELNSSYHNIYTGVDVKINSNGLRDYEYSIEKPKGVFRIAVVGDSFVFGNGVRLEDTFVKQLERKLNKSKQKYEVINFGVSAYNTEQELEVIKTKVLNYFPNLILIGYVLNDAEPKTTIYTDESGKTHKTSELKRSIISRVYRYLIVNSRFIRFVRSYFFKEGMVDSGMINYWKGIYNDDVEWMYQQGIFKEIGEISDDKNIPIIFVIFPLTNNLDDSYPVKWIHNKVYEEALKNRFYTLDLLPYYLGEYPIDITVSIMYNPHLNAKGNQIATDAIYEMLIKEKLVPG